MKNTFAAVMTLLLGYTACALAEENQLSGVEMWGYRKALPAVVNPAVRSPLQNVMSLSVTTKMFQRMEGNVKGSFLGRETWKSLLE